MNTTLQIIIQAVDEASQALANIGDGISADGQKALTAQQQFQQMGQAMTAAGTELLAMGAGADAFYGGAVAAATSLQSAQDSLSASVQNLVSQADASAVSDSGAAAQKAFLTNKINEAQASIQKLSLATETSTQLAKDNGATNAENASKIDTLQQSVQKYQGELDLLNDTQALAGTSAQAIISSFESLAAQNTNLGFSIQDSTSALNGFFTETQSAPDSIAAYNAAMDLARFKGEDLSTASQQVEMALQGQGRSLATLGIQIKDGLTPMQALQALQAQVQGQAQAYSETLSGKLAVALQDMNKLFADIGTTQLPILEALLGDFASIITKVDEWTTEHPKLTAALLASVGVFGALATAAGTLLLTMGLLALALGTVGVAVGAWAIAIIAAVAILAGIVVLIIKYHTEIFDFIQDTWKNITSWLESQWKVITDDWNLMWNDIKDFMTDIMNFIAALINTTLESVTTAWNTAWGGISSFFSGIWDTIKNTLASAITFVTGQLNSLLSIVSSIAGQVSAPIQAVGSVVSSIASTAGKIGSAVGSAIPKFATGGIVNGPTFALVGEAGPEAIIPLSMLGGTGGTTALGSNQAGSINVYLSGNFYTDDQTANKLGNSIAKILNQQLKLKNF